MRDGGSKAMYAVVRTGGKQIKVSPGDVVNVEKLAASPGEAVELTEVLLVSSDQGTTVGTPTVPNAKVLCQVLSEGKAKKIVVYKYKRRKGYARKQGHRQLFTRLSIEDIRVE
jgi:large subunit ribosomal protein L21